jgi:hypothetical protein
MKIIIEADAGEKDCEKCIYRMGGPFCDLFKNFLDGHSRLPVCLAAQREAEAMGEVIEQVKATMSIETPVDVIEAVRTLDEIRRKP